MMQAYKRNFKTNAQVEEMMKHRLSGRAQIKFSSPHFVDEIPWPGTTGSDERVSNQTKVDHLYDNPFYVRKMLEPAKFKKLEIIGWDMPENFTKTVTMQELVQVGMQYGHAAGAWQPKMIQYIYSNMDGTHIFDLVQTAAQLNRACYYAMECASKGAKFMFVGTKEQAGPLIKDHAQRCGAFYAENRFVGGLL